MLIYKQRYKPRTSRAFTKSDLTVYDSAGNTALNALTVYGKSEVVDGSIKSAGEGYAVVDLGTLTWSYTTVFIADLPYEPKIRGGSAFVSIYATDAEMSSVEMPDHSLQIIKTSNDHKIWIKDSTYTNTTAFKTAMSGVILAYQLADPTQGNCIAVKTDNGSGIDGTMATFSTGTPLRGIPDTDVRDVMQWDGSAGTVTKNCGEVDLGTLNWAYDATRQWFFCQELKQLIKPTPTIGDKGNILCPIYTTYSIFNMWATTVNNAIGVNEGATLYVRNSTYTDPAAFKTAMNGVKLVYELATPTTEQLTTAENDSIAGLRTFTPQTHAQNNAGAEMTVDYTIRVPTI